MSQMFADIQVHAAQAAKNGKQAAITQDGEGWYIKFAGSYTTSFNASAFQDAEANRVTLSINADETLQNLAKEIDGFLLKAVQADPAKYMGKAMSAAEVAAGYTPMLRQNAEYQPLVKVKLQKEGRYQVRCWTTSGERAPMPEDWREVTFTPRVWLKALWIAQGGKSWGAQLDLVDCLVEPQEVHCPF